MPLIRRCHYIRRYVDVCCHAGYDITITHTLPHYTIRSLLSLLPYYHYYLLLLLHDYMIFFADIFTILRLAEFRHRLPCLHYIYIAFATTDYAFLLSYGVSRLSLY